MYRGLIAVVVTSFAVACGGSTGSIVEPSAPSDSAEEGPEVGEDVAEANSPKIALRIPLISEDHKLLSKYNAQLTAGGLGTFPDFVEITGKADGTMVNNGDKKWNEASALVDKAYEQLNLEIAQLSWGEPHNYRISDASKTICYKGNPKLLVTLVSSIAGRIFSEQLGIHGWRYRQVKNLSENIAPEDEATFPSVWKNWRGRGNAVLMLTASSDDGDETNVAIIPKCQASQ